MKHGILGIVVALAVALVCLPACAGETVKPTPTPTGPTEVVFGALVSRTGSLSELGKSSEAALEIAVGDINAYLAAVGSKLRVKLLVEDSATNPTVALEKLTALVQRGAKIVIGPHSSSEVRAIKAFAEENGVLLISQSSTASSLAIAGDNVLRFCPNDLQQAEAVARLAWEDGVKALIPMWRGDVWGDDLTNATKASFERLGGTVSDGVRYATDSADFAAAAASLDSKVQQAAVRYGATKVAVVLNAFDEVVPILTQARGYPTLAATKWYGSDATALSDKLLGDANAAQFAATTGFPNPMYSGEGTTQRYEAVAGRVRDKIGREPEMDALVAYDALWVATKAALVAGASDTTALKKALPQEAAQFTGATGWTVLDDTGDRRVGNYDFWAIRGEPGNFRWERVATYQLDPSLTARLVTKLSFPSKPLRITTGWIGGSALFLSAIAEVANSTFGVPAIIVNKIGNDGLDALRDVQSAPKDGYTLLNLIDFYITAHLRGAIDSNPTTDWVPVLIGNIAISQLYIRADEQRYANWDALVAYAKANPGLKVATVGTPLDMEGLSIAAVERAFGLRFQQAPYERAPERNASFIGGETDLLIDQPGDVKEFIDSGKYKPVLTLWNERLKGFETVPTAKEKGATFTPLLRVRALAVPTGTPQDRIAALKTGLRAAFNSPAYQQHLKTNWLDLAPYPDDPATLIREQTEAYKRLYQSVAVTAIEAVNGETITITLKSNPTTGYRWQLAESPDEAIVKLVGSEYKAPPSTTPPLLGAGGEEVWTFQAVGRGQTRLSLKYVRPWEKDAAPAEQRNYEIKVK